jgi:DNA modification methylase
MTSVLEGDARDVLPRLEAASVDCVVTSPPYFRHRDYGSDLGREATVREYVANLVAIFDAVRRVLKPSGSCFVNIGDSYDDKRALLVPQRLALALDDAGWIVRQEIVWRKPNVRPESARDRLTNATEPVLFLTKQPRGYYFNPGPLREPAAWDHWGRQTSPKARALATGGAWQSADPDRRSRLAETKTRHPRNVWDIPSENKPNNGLAPFPEELARRCLVLGCPPGGLALDPFVGSGTTLVVARKLGMRAIGIDCDPAAIAETQRRLAQLTLDVSAQLG